MRIYSLILAIGLLVLSACRSKNEDPQPPAPATREGVTFTDGTGQPIAVTSYLATATKAFFGPYWGSTGQPRYMLEVVAHLANATTFTAYYTYDSEAPFPQATGAVVLQEFLHVELDDDANGRRLNSWGDYTDRGNLQVDALSPRTASGTYTGPLAPNGPTVRFTFTRIFVNIL